jgi:hypothetical protein
MSSRLFLVCPYRLYLFRLLYLCMCSVLLYICDPFLLISFYRILPFILSSRSHFCTCDLSALLIPYLLLSLLSSFAFFYLSCKRASTIFLRDTLGDTPGGTPGDGIPGRYTAGSPRVPPAPSPREIPPSRPVGNPWGVPWEIPQESRGRGGLQDGV